MNASTKSENKTTWFNFIKKILVHFIHIITITCQYMIVNVVTKIVVQLSFLKLLVKENILFSFVY